MYCVKALSGADDERRSRMAKFGSPNAECECCYNFTCCYCLRNAKPWIWTSTPETWASNYARFLAKQKADELNHKPNKDNP